MSVPTPNPAPPTGGTHRTIRRGPAAAVIVGACAWATAGGLLFAFADGGWRRLAFQMAAWPPVLVLLVPLVRAQVEAHWVRMAAGVLLFPLAVSLESAWRSTGWAEPSGPSLSDLCYAAGYVLLASGIWTLIHRHGRRQVRNGLLDTAVVLIPAVTLLVQYVVHLPPDAITSSSWELRLLVALYPLADVVLLTGLVWLLAVPTLHRAHLGLLAAGMALTLWADIFLAMGVLSPGATARLLTEGVYPLSFTLLAAGVARGATTRLGRPRQSSVVHWGRVGVLAMGAILGPLVIVIAAVPPVPLPVLAVATATVASSGWIVWRMLELARVLGVTTGELSRARHELQVQATHDPLTGLLNRAVLDDVLDSLRDPDSRPAALLSIDLDEFKAVNDTFGHEAGDAVLLAVSDRLRAALRSNDLVLRMGGDEFLATLHNITAAEADDIAQRLVRAVEQPVEHRGGRLHVSASVGVALLGMDEPAARLDDTMSRADAAMYAAKRSGRGHIRTATGGPGATVTDHDDTTDSDGDGPVDPHR